MSHAQNVHRVQTTAHSPLHLTADSASDSSALTLKSHSQYLSMQMPSSSRLFVECAKVANSGKDLKPYQYAQFQNG